MTISQIAEAISKHNFESTYEYFSDEIIWNMIGANVVRGKENVKKTCEESAKYLASIKTTFNTFKTHTAQNTIIVESSADYIDDKNDKSTVSSCDVYNFDGDKLIDITSYNIELPQ